MTSLGIGVILGSTRKGRKGESVAQWVLRCAAGRAANYELIDLLDRPLPHLEEPVPAMAGRYSSPQTIAWAEHISGFDGFIIVTPEYNHGIPGVLKDALDHLYAEWNTKAVGFVGYGIAGGARSIDQLRVLSGVLGMTDVRTQVELSLFRELTEGEVHPQGGQERALAQVFDQVEAWATALAPLRNQQTPSRG